MLRGFTRNFKPLELLTEEQVQAVHRGILTVLEDGGLKFDQEDALHVLEQAGCRVDHRDQRVRIPPGLVLECLGKCPTSFLLKARDGNKDVSLGGNVLYFASTPGMRYFDPERLEPREPTRKEFYDAVTIYDALEHLHILHGNSPCFSFQGVPPAISNIATYAARTRNSTKLSGISSTPLDTDIFQIQIAQAVGAVPSCGLPATPPLSFARDALSGAIRGLKAGTPLMIVSGDVYGVTSPVTIAGALVQNCATIMGGIVLTQLISPGRGVLAANFTWPANMRTGGPFFGNIAVSLHDVAFNQVWREYGIPVGNLEAGIPGAKSIDFQAGYEKALQAFAAGASGANLIWFHGCVHGELMSHPIQAILDDDIAGMIGRFLEGVSVNDDTLAVDLIKEVSPFRRVYLDNEHTLNWWKKEQFIPKSADLLSLQDWLSTGKKTAIDRAKDRMREILGAHKPLPLTASQEEDIEKILREAADYFEKKTV